MLTFVRRTLSSLALALVATACNGPVENAIDCHRVCERYSACYDASYDVAACDDRCRVAANADASFQMNIDACDACIGDMSCLSATFNCASVCGGIVP